MPLAHAWRQGLALFAAEDDEWEVRGTQREEAVCLFNKPDVRRAGRRGCGRPGVRIRREEIGERWLWLE